MDKQQILEALSIIVEAQQETPDGMPKRIPALVRIGDYDGSDALYITGCGDNVIDALTDNGFFVSIEAGQAKVFTKGEQ